MTRINVIPVEELEREHLLGEWKEITRVFTQRRNAIQAKRIIKIPKEYTLGTGHVSFFTDKLGFVLNRYHELRDEMLSRGYKPKPIPDELLKSGIDERFFRGYTPTEQALMLNRERIAKRLKGDKT